MGKSCKSMYRKRYKTFDTMTANTGRRKDISLELAAIQNSQKSETKSSETTSTPDIDTNYKKSLSDPRVLEEELSYITARRLIRQLTFAGISTKSAKNLTFVPPKM